MSNMSEKNTPINSEKKSVLRAIQSKNVKPLQLFVKKYPNYLTELYYQKTGDSVLHIAARLGRTDAVQFMLKNLEVKCIIDIKNNDDKTPLHEASQFCQTDCLELLIDYGANVNAIKRSDWTPLMLACTKIKKEEVNLNIVKILIKEGALINFTNKDGWSALHLICREPAPNILNYLIDNKCDLTRITKNGRSALHIACLHLNIDAVVILLNNSVDVNLKDFSGNAPIHEATLGGSVDILELLIQHGANVFARNAADYTILHLAASVSHPLTIKYIINDCKIPINVTNKSKLTPLHCAAKKANVKAYNFLKCMGADECAVDAFGRTPSNYLNNDL